MSHFNYRQANATPIYHLPDRLQYLEALFHAFVAHTPVPIYVITWERFVLIELRTVLSSMRWRKVLMVASSTGSSRSCERSSTAFSRSLLPYQSAFYCLYMWTLLTPECLQTFA